MTQPPVLTPRRVSRAYTQPASTAPTAISSNPLRLRVASMKFGMGATTSTACTAGREHGCAARQRLHLRYLSRGKAQSTEREVSPQRLVHDRDNWHLDAWCHLRDERRKFSLDAIEQVRIFDHPARDIPEAELDTALGAGYGIFSGHEVQWATLRFTPHRARWVAAETWHPQQRGTWDEAGRWLLELPYADPRELEMDILRHIPHIEVLAPAERRQSVMQKMLEGLRGNGADSGARSGLDKRGGG